MIMEKGTKSGPPRCMARSELPYNALNKPYILMNCYDAVL